MIMLLSDMSTLLRNSQVTHPANVIERNPAWFAVLLAEPQHVNRLLPRVQRVQTNSIYGNAA